LIPQKFGGAPEYDKGDRVIVQWNDGLWYKAHVMESTARFSLVKFTDGSLQKVSNELISTDDENDSDDEEGGKEREDDDEEDMTEDEQTEANRANDPNNVWKAISKRRKDHHHRASVSPFSLCN
jgi:glutamine synthetase adenylyltransferase